MIFLILFSEPIIINSVLVKLGVSLFAKSQEFIQSSFFFDQKFKLV